MRVVGKPMLSACAPGATAHDYCKGCCVQADAEVCSGTRKVDALLQWPAGCAALEVDGPTHFLTDTATGTRDRIDGATALHNHELREAGVRVVSAHIEGRSFQELRGAAFQAQLAQMLRDKGVPTAGDTLDPGNIHSADSTRLALDARCRMLRRQRSGALAVQRAASALARVRT